MRGFLDLRVQQPLNLVRLAVLAHLVGEDEVAGPHEDDVPGHKVGGRIGFRAVSLEVVEGGGVDEVADLAEHPVLPLALAVDEHDAVGLRLGLPAAIPRVIHKVLAVGGEDEAPLVRVTVGAILAALQGEEDAIGIAPTGAQRHAAVLGPVAGEGESWRGVGVFERDTIVVPDHRVGVSVLEVPDGEASAGPVHAVIEPADETVLVGRGDPREVGACGVQRLRRVACESAAIVEGRGMVPRRLHHVEVVDARLPEQLVPVLEQILSPRATQRRGERGQVLHRVLVVHRALEVGAVGVEAAVHQHLDLGDCLLEPQVGVAVLALQRQRGHAQAPRCHRLPVVRVVGRPPAVNRVLAQRPSRDPHPLGLEVKALPDGLLLRIGEVRVQRVIAPCHAVQVLTIAQHRVRVATEVALREAREVIRAAVAVFALAGQGKRNGYLVERLRRSARAVQAGGRPRLRLCRRDQAVVVVADGVLRVCADRGVGGRGLVGGELQPGVLARLGAGPRVLAHRRQPRTGHVEQAAFGLVDAEARLAGGQ